MHLFTAIAAYLRGRPGTDEGATVVEFGLLVSLIAVVVIAGMTVFGDPLDDVLAHLTEKF